jgi:hypothetical protein
MEAMDPRHLELYDMIKPRLGEEPARRLVQALPPAPAPDRIATHDDIARLEARMDAGFARMEATLTRRMFAAMGAWTVLLGTAFAWASAVLR